MKEVKIMITLGLIALLILIALVLILIGAGGFIVGFGWILFIVADVALAIWIIGKIIKKLCGK
jgi:hypothetical protein